MRIVPPALFPLLTLIMSGLALANPDDAPSREAVVRRFEKVCRHQLKNLDPDAPPVPHPEKVCRCESTNFDHKLSLEELTVFTKALEGNPRAEAELQEEKFADLIDFADRVERACHKDPQWSYEPQKAALPEEQSRL